MDGALLARLPPKALAKARRLADAADEANVLLRSAQTRIADLNRVLILSPDAPNASALELEMERLNEALAQHAIRHKDRGNLLAQLRGFLAQLPRSAELHDAPPPTVRLEKDESRPQAVVRLRSEIASAQAMLKEVIHAPAPVEDQKAQARRYVEDLAAKAKGRLTFEGGTFNFTLETGSYSGQPNWKVLQAAINPEAFVAFLDGLIDTRPAPTFALTREEKAKRTAELRTELERLERLEEEVIDSCERAEGNQIARRVKADPKAVLGVVIAQAQKRQASIREAAE